MMCRRSFLGLPLARRSNRRRIVLGWWLVTLALLTASALALRAHPEWTHSWLSGYCFAILLVLASSMTRWMWAPQPDPRKVSAGVRTLFDTSWRRAQRESPPCDERELVEWSRAKSIAYDAFVLAAVLALPLRSGSLILARPWLRESLIWFAIFFILNLPQSIYLWSEPDVEMEAEAATQ